MATNIKLSKTQIKKLIQSRGFLGKLLSKLAGPLMKVAMSLASAGIKLIIEQEDMNDIIKIIEALENSGILLKGVTKTIENETKEQRGGFLSMLLGRLGASLLGNLLTGGKGLARAGEGIARAAEGSVASRAKGEGIIRAGEGSKKKTILSFNKY